MEVDQTTVGHLADLSNFVLSDQENQALQTNIQEILTYVSQLDQLDTEGIEPTYQVFEMTNVWRPDEILPQDASCDELLALTPTVEKHQIKVPKVL